MYTAYLITNTVNNMKYVGMTCRNPKKRFREHVLKSRRGSSSYLHCAIREFGESCFRLSILETNISEQDHELKERYYINTLNTYYANGYGYNQTIGGNGTVGYIFTDEDKNKMSKSMTGKTYSDERNEKIRNAMLGRDYKKEWRDKLSKSRIGKYTGSDNPFYHKTHSNETKEKISNCNTKHAVLQYDPSTYKLICIFKNSSFAADWVLQSKLTHAKKSTCLSRIHSVCKYDDMNHTAYGYIWRFGEKSID